MKSICAQVINVECVKGIKSSVNYCQWPHKITSAYEIPVYFTCFGAGPAGMRTIFDVTSTTLSQTSKFEFDFSFSGHRWSLTPEQGARFVTKIKWFFPFDPYSTEKVSWEIDTSLK